MTLNASSHDRVLLPGLTAEGARDLTDQTDRTSMGPFNSSRLRTKVGRGKCWGTRPGMTTS